MSTEIYNVRLCRAYKSYADWMQDETILLYGEFAIASNIPDLEGTRMKVGDGYKTFAELPWFSDPDAIDDDDINIPEGAIRLDKNGQVSIDLIPDEILYTEENTEENE